MAKEDLATETFQTAQLLVDAVNKLKNKTDDVVSICMYHPSTTGNIFVLFYRKS